VTYGIEPSAGDGSFVDVMKEMLPKVIAIDIEPKRSDIKKSRSHCHYGRD
jgi:hypothetical protein